MKEKNTKPSFPRISSKPNTGKKAQKQQHTAAGRAQSLVLEGFQSQFHHKTSAPAARKISILERLRQKSHTKAFYTCKLSK